MRKLVCLICFIALLSCNTRKQQVVAKVDDTEITMNDIDQIINEQLFHMLEGIYLIRKQALNEYINQIVISKEAKKQNTSVEKLLDNTIMSVITDSSINKRIVELKGLVPDRSDYRRVYDCNTAYGREYLRESMIIEAKTEYANKLREKHNVEILLNAPDKFRPEVDLAGIKLNYKGNADSKIELILVGSYECEGCLQAKPIIDYFESKYGNRIKTSFCYYDGQPSLASMAVEAAGLQNKYWEMHELVFTSHENTDTCTVMDYAKDMTLNLDKFKKDLSSQQLREKVESNIKIINKNKIVTTPTIIINDHVFNAPFNQNDMESFIIKCLD